MNRREWYEADPEPDVPSPTLEDYKRVFLIVGRMYGKNFKLVQAGMGQAVNSIGTHLHTQIELFNKVSKHFTITTNPPPVRTDKHGRYLPPPHPMTGTGKVFDRKGHLKR